MKLLNLRLHCPETLGHFELSLQDEPLEARPLTLIYGGPGAGKTTLLRAIASTRPGHVIVSSLRASDAPCFASTDWLLGIDEPDRKHPLRLCSPNSPEDFVQLDMAERREGVFFDRLAKEGGFAFLFFSALRWFSKPHLSLTAPVRTLARYDVRAFEPPDDATRNDLARDTKQALAYAAITSSLPADGFSGPNHKLLGTAMVNAVERVAAIYGYHYLGIEPRSLEAMFASAAGRATPFDNIPSQLKHAVAIPALLVRTFWGAYPNLNPLSAQGVVAIDQFELHQEDSRAVRLLDVLVSLFPSVQWLATTCSPVLLASRDAGEIVALRRRDETGFVQVHAGELARVH